MPIMNNMDKFADLRKQFPWFKYESFDYKIENQYINITFTFNLSGKFIFNPSINIPVKHPSLNNLSEFQGLDNLIFHIGMVELISYWKAACPKLLIVEPFFLTDDQINWWKKLYFNGLGEFFYTNGITTSPDDFMEIQSNGTEIARFNSTSHEKVLIPVGGGKDSAVTLELLKNNNLTISPFIINPRSASLETCRIAGFKHEELFLVNRTLDKKLLELNKQGFLNGHTPFSALLAFVSLAVATIHQFRYIALSNESSANEPTVTGSEVNHQYSKSLEFEIDFRQYVSSYIQPDIEYFSFLRPINELQIGKLFSSMPGYFPVFKSCNVGSKNDSWCCKCPKCLFTYIILAPFIEFQTLVGTFGKNLFDDSDLIPILDELIGITPTKPFECVGTIDDVKAALSLTLAKFKGTDLPALLAHYLKNMPDENFMNPDFSRQLLNDFSNQHFLNEPFISILKHAIHP